MSTPRRRLVRAAPAPAPRSISGRQVQRWRSELEAEHAALARWMKRLKRAFSAVNKAQQRIARLEHKLARQEE